MKGRPKRREVPPLSNFERRQMWNEFADHVFKAAVLLGRLPEFRGRDDTFLTRLLVISLVIRKQSPGHPEGGKRGAVQEATNRVAERVREKRRNWLAEHSKSYFPERQLQDLIIREIETERRNSGVSPLPEAVRNAYRSGTPKRSGRRNRTHAEIRKFYERAWLSRADELFADSIVKIEKEERSRR